MGRNISGFYIFVEIIPDIFLGCLNCFQRVPMKFLKVANDAGLEYNVTISTFEVNIAESLYLRAFCYFVYMVYRQSDNESNIKIL